MGNWNFLYRLDDLHGQTDQGVGRKEMRRAGQILKVVISGFMGMILIPFVEWTVVAIMISIILAIVRTL